MNYNPYDIILINNYSVSCLSIKIMGLLRSNHMYPGKHAYGTFKLLPIFLCLLALLLVGCDFGGTTPPPKKLVKAPASKQVYTVPQVGISDIATLDPALV